MSTKKSKTASTKKRAHTNKIKIKKTAQTSQRAKVPNSTNLPSRQAIAFPHKKHESPSKNPSRLITIWRIFFVLILLAVIVYIVVPSHDKKINQLYICGETANCTNPNYITTFDNEPLTGIVYHEGIDFSDRTAPKTHAYTPVVTSKKKHPRKCANLFDY